MASYDEASVMFLTLLSGICFRALGRACQRFKLLIMSFNTFANPQPPALD